MEASFDDVRSTLRGAQVRSNVVHSPAALLLFGFVWFGGEAHAQVCEDRDADGYSFGFACPTSSDCRDRDWTIHPGVADVCNGFDDDCDRDLDSLGCDRFCDMPVLGPDRAELLTENLVESEGGCGVATHTGFLFVHQRYVSPSPDNDTLLYARAYDRFGRPLGPSSAIGEPAILDPYERRCTMASAGDRAVVVWQDSHTRNQSTYRFMARVVDLLGRPFGAPPVDLSSTYGLPAWGSRHGVDWDGARFVVFWTPWSQRWNLLVSFVDPEGNLLDPATRVVTSNVDGAASTIQDVRAVWTGEHFVVVLWHDGPEPSNNLRVLTVSRDGELLTNEPIPTRAGELEVALGRDRVGIFWSGATSTQNIARCAFVDLDGHYLADPGVVTLFATSEDYDPREHHVAWSGEHFQMVFNTSHWTGSGYTGRWYGWRVLPDGTNLDGGGSILDQGPQVGNPSMLSWTGRDWKVVSRRNVGRGRNYAQSLVCRCDDPDGDSYSCFVGDCDELDPLTHPGAVESCTGHRDEDCDGLVDCDDPDCPAGPPPSDPSDLRWGGSEIAWTAPPGAQRYDLARGLLSDVIRRGDLLESECPGVELAGPSWSDDGRIPPSGQVLWFLVRAEGAPCALGTWGDASIQRDVRTCR